MIESLKPAGVPHQPAADTAAGWEDASKKALHFMLGAQRMMLEEIAFTAFATLDSVRTETHLFGEFASKLASSHSVHDWKSMAEQCTQHQLEFQRRECDRMLRHGERLVESASSLFDNR